MIHDSEKQRGIDIPRRSARTILKRGSITCDGKKWGTLFFSEIQKREAKFEIVTSGKTSSEAEKK